MGSNVTRRQVLAAGAAVAGSAALGPLRSGRPRDAATARASERKAKPTIVLVHGGVGRFLGLERESSRAAARRYPVIAPANPLRGLASDAAYIRSVLDTIDGPVVLVGHSYGGAVITNAATGDPNVKALVYIAAFAPDSGETLVRTGRR